MAILISGTGSNMEAIVKACQSGDLNAEVTFVGSSHASAKGIETAAANGLKTYIFDYKKLGRDAAEDSIIKAVLDTQSEWIVLAGFMKVLSPCFVKRFSGKIINIHPSLLPAFSGAHGIKDAWDAGVKVSGVTIHLVDEGVDTGPILAQEEVKIYENDTMESFKERIHKVEHRLYKETLKKIFNDKKPTYDGGMANAGN